MKKLLIDVKPSNSKLEDITPRNAKIKDPMQTYTMTIARGQYMGSPPGLTYPAEITGIVTAEQ